MHEKKRWLEQSELVSGGFKEQAEPLTKDRAGFVLAAFPSAHDIVAGSDLVSNILLGPATQLALRAQGWMW